MEKRLHPGSDYVPIHWSVEDRQNTDAYYYYAHVEEVLAGHPFSWDPSTYEGKFGKRLTAHYSYSLSYILCALGGIFTRNIDHAYCFDFFFYPALTIFLMGIFSLQLTQSPFFSLLSVILAARQMVLMGRILHPMVTAFPIVLIGILLYKLSERSRRSLAVMASLAFLVGVSILLSVADFFLSFFLLGTFLISTFFDRPLHKRLWLISIVAFLVALPTLILFHSNIKVFDEIFHEFAIPPVYLMYHFDPLKYLTDLPLFFVPLAFFFVFEFPGRKFFLRSYLGSLLAFSALSFWHGSIYGYYTVTENIPFAFTVGFAGFYLICREVFRTGRITLSPFFRHSSFSVPAGLRKLFPSSKTAAVLLWLFFLGFSAFNFRGTIRYRLYLAEARLPLSYDRDFKSFYTWARQQTHEGDVATPRFPFGGQPNR